MSQQWWVYILECGDGSYYTGIATDVDARVLVHNAGKGAKYTRSKLPVKVVYQEPQASRSAASQREYQLKQLSRSEKIHLLTTAHKS